MVDSGNGHMGEIRGASGGEELSILPEYLASEPAPAAPPPPAGEDEGKREKRKGRNQNRPPPLKFGRGQRLCPILVDVAEGEDVPKCAFPNCSFLHDVKVYVKEKAPDIGEECHLFNAFGRCPRGVSCRFGQSHIVEGDDGVPRNKVVGDAPKNSLASNGESNHLSKDLQMKLRKKDVDFKECDDIVDYEYKARAEQKEAESKEQPLPEVKKARVDVDESTPQMDESGTRKRIDWRNKLYLAPLTTVGNMPFRRICKRLGADITCGEMAMGLPLLQGMQPEWALVQRHQSEDIFGVQLCGNNPNQMTRVAQIIEENIDCDFVDINLGCPIDLVYKRGMGCGLMGRRKPLEVMVRAMTRVMSRPLTLKMRTGIYADKPLAQTLLPLVKEWGVDMVTLHGRSREQRYTRLADWKFVAECAQLVKPLPIYGNGDILSYEDYIKHKSDSNVDGIMIARGALIKPWIFTEIKENRHWDISAGERLDLIRDYVNFGLEHWGSDDKGVENTRRFLLEWLSFLHRYVPVGILSQPPQKINLRVPRYVGRSELETLLASPSCSDWISITEMFLGKVPDGFSFQPKHKAHAYKQ